MNRRSALVWALWAAVVGSAAGAVPRVGAAARQAVLPAALADLYDERFAAALPRTSSSAIAARLVARGVLAGATDNGNAGRQQHRWRFDAARVRARAASDALIEFDRSLYTETELLLYAYVARVASGRHPSPVGGIRLPHDQ